MANGYRGGASLICAFFFIAGRTAHTQWQHQGGSLNRMLESTGAFGICPLGSNPVSLTKGFGVQGLSQTLLIADYPHSPLQSHPIPVDPHRHSTLARPHPGPHLAQPLLQLTEGQSTLLHPWLVQGKQTQ